MENNYNNGGLLPVMVDSQKVVQAEKPQNPFILGNSVEVDIDRLQEDYLVPVFSRDNVESISHTDFISTVFDAAQEFFQGQQFNNPIIRCSHELKVRTKFGAGKLVENLSPEDSGSYMQRMMFVIEIPSISYTVNGNTLNLQIVGVRNYADVNLLGNSSQKQTFSVGLGFNNIVCTNGLLRSDGCNLAIKVTNTADLLKYCLEVFRGYDWEGHVKEMATLDQIQITVPVLAQFLGRCRMYNALPSREKLALNLPEFILPEAQINSFVRDYYSDENFGGFGSEISAWNFYQLLTNYKNNYIDLAMPRTINAYDTALGISKAIKKEDPAWSWFIS
jgi:hypothetical protein